MFLYKKSKKNSAHSNFFRAKHINLVPENPDNKSITLKHPNSESDRTNRTTKKNGRAYQNKKHRKS
jgi:hypothetical protein